jgi:hypothetical protein
MLEAKLDGEVIYTPNPLLDMLPKGEFIYVFSVFPMEKVVSKGSLGKYCIPACPTDAEVSPALKIPVVVMSSYFDAGSQSMKTDIVKGEMLAQDLIRPYTLADWSVGNALEDLGVFWTRKPVPTPAEIKTARSKLEKTFRKELVNATKLETTDQLEFITPLMRLAASYFKEDRPWNKIYKKLEPCFACGDDVRAGVIIHSCGAVMPGKWPAAIAAGLRTKQQALDAGVDLDAPKGKEKPPAKA